jgi:Domain of unknown function (DUF6894)
LWPSGETTPDSGKRQRYINTIVGNRLWRWRLRDRLSSRHEQGSRVMGRYYFNVDDGSNIRDTLGMDLPALAAAKCEAVRYASRLICDDAEHFWDAGVFQMTVSDEKGLTIFALTLTLAADEAPVTRTAQFI